MVHILNKLDILCWEVKTWKQHKTKILQNELNDIQSELDALCPQVATNYLPKSTQIRIHALELKKKESLSIEEATWRLKSRAIWTNEGD